MTTFLFDKIAQRFASSRFIDFLEICECLLYCIIVPHRTSAVYDECRKSYLYLICCIEIQIDDWQEFCMRVTATLENPCERTYPPFHKCITL
jgi:hypothetical protein